MFNLKKIMGLGIAILVCAFIWYGCSGDSSDPLSTDPAYHVADYFPLTAGNSLFYTVNYNATDDTLQLEYLVGNPVFDGSRYVYPWYETNVKVPFWTDTGYMFISGDALYYYDRSSSMVDKLLEGPFEVGHSWLRFSSDVIPGGFDQDGWNDNTNAKGDGDDGGDGDYNKNDDANGGGATKSYPIHGSNLCQITAIEDVSFDGGRTFDNCIRVENYSNSSINYYWYAPGVGLIKYALGINLAASEDNSIVGEYGLTTGN